jgi:primosomal protein N' (replication factor Y)
MGTQRVEDVVAKIFPKARMARVDSDAIRCGNTSWIERMQMGHVDILVGTQMVAKGFAFPKVTLVGVLNADSALYINDFRAEERAFQTLIQAVGRGGRGLQLGEAVIQTFAPSGEHIVRAEAMDVEGFLNQQECIRREYGYPPHRHLIRHIFRGNSREKVWFFMEQWEKLLRGKLPPTVECRGPLWAVNEKINGVYRGSMVYFTRNVTPALSLLFRLRAGFKLSPGVRDVWDVDPVDFS